VVVLRRAVLREAGLLAVLAAGLLAADLLVERDAGLLAVLPAGLLAVRRAGVLAAAALVAEAGFFAAAATDARNFSKSLITARLLFCASRRNLPRAAATSL